MVGERIEAEARTKCLDNPPERWGVGKAGTGRRPDRGSRVLYERWRLGLVGRLKTFVTRKSFTPLDCEDNGSH